MLTNHTLFNLRNYSLTEIDQNNIFNSEQFTTNYTYSGDDLGAIYTPMHTDFKIWAPLATTVTLNLYHTGSGETLHATYSMSNGLNGIWYCHVVGDLNGIYYTYTIENFGITAEVVDPYAKSSGVNGQRGMVIDFMKTNPSNWSQDTYCVPSSSVDAIIYELHLRDLSMSSNSGILNKGKYLGLSELGTTNVDGLSTGLSHIKELGVTHIHLLPIYDYNSVDEAHLEKNCFNWGYDPLNYNVLEGSYSLDPTDGTMRVKEFKQMVSTLHSQGIGIIMDVVYNHTAEAENSFLNRTVPHYYHRCNADGSFNDGSACGNEIASDRLMVRKMIVDSVVFWAKEYHIDGFRFDLMGILDIATMNEIRKELDAINPNILMYGEGWFANPVLLDDDASAIKANTPKLNTRIASFSDDMRDAIKGHVFYEAESGFVNGNKTLVDSIKFGIVASTKHPQINYGNINYSKDPWALEPTQCVTYTSAHDNFTLFDKLQITCPDADISKLIQMNKMAATLVFTSQGIAFIQAGDELLRTKVKPDGSFEHNSYISPDSINQLDWSRKTTYHDVFDYYQGLIALRKAHPAFRMQTTSDINTHLEFIEMPHPNTVGYFINGYAKDTWKQIGVFFNPNDEVITLPLPSKDWVIVVNSDHAGIHKLDVLTNGQLVLPPHSHYVIVDSASFNLQGCTI